MFIASEISLCLLAGMVAMPNVLAWKPLAESVPSDFCFGTFPFYGSTEEDSCCPKVTPNPNPTQHSTRLEVSNAEMSTVQLL